MQTNISEKFYDFIDILRDASVNISVDEVLTMFNALPYVSIQNKSTFKQALQTTLIKDFTDIPVFNKCFEEFFCGNGDTVIDIENAAKKMNDQSRQKNNDTLAEKDLSELENMINSYIDDIAENMIFEKSSENLLKLFLDELQTSGSSGGLGFTLFKTLSSLIQSYNNEGVSENNYDDEADLRDLLLRLIDKKLAKKKIGKEIKKREDYLLNKFIYKITPNEIIEMKELIRRFGQKLKNRISLRKKRVKHGGIDIKRTFRTSLEFGGVPFKIFYKDRKIDRPQLVVLCDVSGSVNQYTRFMLLLTHTLQSLFSKVRTFAFISSMVEITKLFMEMDPERAVNSIFYDTNFTYGWGSNYGKCFNEFIDNYSDSLNKKTTVLVLGDGRNNNQDPGLNSFIKIKERSRNLFWLNPDKKHLWNWSDSVAFLYQEYCTEMKEVNSFRDLSEFIDKLFINI